MICKHNGIDMVHFVLANKPHGEVEEVRKVPTPTGPCQNPGTAPEALSEDTSGFHSIKFIAQCTVNSDRSAHTWCHALGSVRPLVPLPVSDPDKPRQTAPTRSFSLSFSGPQAEFGLFVYQSVCELVWGVQQDRGQTSYERG
jgi:hypothetical protein